MRCNTDVRRASTFRGSGGSGAAVWPRAVEPCVIREKSANLCFEVVPQLWSLRFPTERSLRRSPTDTAIAANVLWIMGN